MALCRQCSARCRRAGGAAAGTGVRFSGSVDDQKKLYRREVDNLHNVSDDEKNVVFRNQRLSFPGKLAVLTFLHKIRVEGNYGRHEIIGITDIMDHGIINLIQDQTRNNPSVDSEMLESMIFAEFDADKRAKIDDLNSGIDSLESHFQSSMGKFFDRVVASHFEGNSTTCISPLGFIHSNLLPAAELRAKVAEFECSHFVHTHAGAHSPGATRSIYKPRASHT